jgi:Replication-relaxation
MTTHSSNKGTKKKGYQFTSRDGQMLHFTYELDKPDTSHYTKILFRPTCKPAEGQPTRAWQTTSAQAIRRLEHLTRDGFLKAERPPLITGMPYLPYAFSLTAKGYEEVAVIRGVAVKELNRPRKLISTRSIHYLHHKRVLDVLTDAMISAELAHIPLIMWKKTRTLREEYQEYQADLYLRVNVGGRLLNLFPEIDLGTETEGQFKERLGAMMRFLKSPYYRTTYPSPDTLRFPVITTSEERMHMLMKWAREAQASSRIWFTTFTRLTPEAVFTELIWIIATVDGQYHLTQL